MSLKGYYQIQASSYYGFNKYVFRKLKSKIFAYTDFALASHEQSC